MSEGEVSGSAEGIEREGGGKGRRERGKEGEREGRREGRRERGREGNGRVRKEGWEGGAVDKLHL